MNRLTNLTRRQQLIILLALCVLVAFYPLVSQQMLYVDAQAKSEVSTGVTRVQLVTQNADVLHTNQTIAQTVQFSTGYAIKVKVSHYYPGWGGPNCAIWQNGQCVSRMASGRKWQKYVDRACACPVEFPFGTVFVIAGREWTCWDRGGAIVRVNKHTVWVDLLTKEKIAPHGAVLDAEVRE